MRTNKIRNFLLCGIICFIVILTAGVTLVPNSSTAFANNNATVMSLEQLKFNLINNDQEYRVSASDKKIVEAIIPTEYQGKPVTEIAANGFMFCNQLTLVEIPETIRKIGNAAFSDCENLKEVYFITNGEKGVNEIGMDAFAYCAIENIIIPNTVESIGRYAFDGCSEDSEIIVRKEEKAVTFKSVFNTYDGTVRYDINNLVLNKISGQNAYRISNYQNIFSGGELTIPFHNVGNRDASGNPKPSLDDGYPIVEIGRRAFINCELDLLEIGTCNECAEHKINIARQAFYSSHINSINLNNNVIIEEDADSIFAGSTVKHISLPNNITHIPFSSFQNCTELSSITTTVTDENHLPDSIVNIGDDAFSKCTSLNYLFIPKSIALSGSNIGIYIFEYWTSTQVIEFELTHEPEEWSGIRWNGGDTSLRWQPLTIKFDANLNEANPYNFSASIEHGQTLGDINYIPTPTSERFKFTGWYTESGDLVNATDPLTQNQTLYAGWVSKDFKITFEDNDYVIFNYSGSGTVNYNSSITFTVTVRGPYNQSAPIIRDGNYQRLIPNSNGIYTISNITSNQYIYTEQLPLNKYAISFEENDYLIFNYNGAQPIVHGNTVVFNIIVNNLYNQSIPTIFGNGTQLAVTKIKTGEYSVRISSLSCDTVITVADMSLNLFDVILSQEGGKNGSQNIKVTYGEVMPNASAPTREGYTFKGYFDRVNGEGKQYYYADMSSASNWDKLFGETLFAYWSNNQYTITLDDGREVTVQYEKQLPDITIPSRAGYTFTGYFDVAGKQYYNASGKGLVNWDKPNDSNLFASWSNNKYTVTLDDGRKITVEYDKSLPDITIPSRTGYTFTGYFDAAGKQYYNASGEGTANWDKPYDSNLIASWSNNKYIVTLDDGRKITVEYDKSLPDITIPSRTGYTFTGYFDAAGKQYYNASGKGLVNWDKPNDSNLIAAWSNNKYIVTLDDGRKITVEYDKPLPDITIPSRTGYTFKGHFDAAGKQYYNASGKGISNWDKAYDSSLFAQWAGNNYEIVLDKKGGTSGTSLIQAEYEKPMQAIITPVRTGYTFAGYFDAAGTQYYTANGISAKNWNKTSGDTLYAQWTCTLTFYYENGTSKTLIINESEKTSLYTFSVSGGFNGLWNEIKYDSTKKTYTQGSTYTAAGNAIFNQSIVEKTLSECLTSGVYEIWTLNQLNGIRSLTTGTITGTFKLMANIDLGSANIWTPIGFKSNGATPQYFNGTFDGNDKTISNMTLDIPNTVYPSSGYACFGLFSMLYNGTIKNLNMTNVTINSVSVHSLGFVVVGAICGYNYKGTIEKCTVRSLKNPSSSQLNNAQNFSVTCHRTYSWLGGITGYNCQGTIKDSTNYMSMYGNGEIGGIAGFSDTATITNCKNYGNIALYVAVNRFEYNNAGGIVARTDNATTTFCENFGYLKYVNDAYNGTRCPCIGLIVGLNINSVLNNPNAKNNIGYVDSGTLKIVYNLFEGVCVQYAYVRNEEAGGSFAAL